MMADCLSRGYRLQLTTAMEKLVKSAVYEISQIFEQSLRDRELDLARKGDEIAHLKGKLRGAEMKLAGLLVASDDNTDVRINQTTPRKSKESPPEESTDSEIDLEELEDWCVPLGFENVFKQENPCPSVQLKQFSIPLWPISLNHEAFLKLQHPRLRPRHNKMGLHEYSQHKRKRGKPRVRSLKNDQLKKIKQESCDAEVESPTRRKEKSVKVQKTHNLRRRAPSASTGHTYQCRLCPKTFDTAFGLGIHDRAHRKCKGCKRTFPFLSVLEQHQVKCKRYKKSVKFSAPSPVDKISQRITSNSSSERQRPGRMFTCGKCRINFVTRSLLMMHSCNFVCQICSKTFKTQASLKAHMTRKHRKLREMKPEVSWTIPLDESRSDFNATENNVKKRRGGCKYLVCATKRTALERYDARTEEKPFKCGLCPKVFSRRAALIQHRISFHRTQLKKNLMCVCSKRFEGKFQYKHHKLSCPTAIAHKKGKRA